MLPAATAALFCSLGLSSPALANPVDLVVLLEGSGKISAAEFVELQAFGADLAIGQDIGTRIAVAQYGPGDRVETRLSDGLDRVQTVARLNALSQLAAPGASADVELAGAIDTVVNDLFSAAESPDGRDRVLLVVGENPPTDFNCGGGGDATRALLESRHVRAIVVTAGGVSHPADYACLGIDAADNFVDSPVPRTFGDLTSVTDAVIDRINADPPPLPTPIPSPSPTPAVVVPGLDLAFLVEGSGRISAAEFDAFKSFLTGLIIPLPADVRFALAQYGDGAGTEFRFSDGLSRAEAAGATNAAAQLEAPGSSAGSNLGGGIGEVVANIFDPTESPDGRDRVMIILAESRPTDFSCSDPSGAQTRQLLEAHHIRAIVVTAGGQVLDDDFECIGEPGDRLVDSAADPLAFGDLPTQIDPVLALLGFGDDLEVPADTPASRTVFGMLLLGAGIVVLRRRRSQA